MPLPKNSMFFGFKEKMTEEQQIYVDSMFDNELTIVNAPAGTGKTTLAVAAAKMSGMKLVYIFAPVEEDSMGFRPGDQFEKELAYLGPLMGALIEIGENPSMSIYNELLARDPKQGKDVMKWEKEGKTWVYPRSHIFARGTNIADRFVIIDECQNYTKSQLKKVLTRLHTPGTRTVMIGHTGQIDLPDPEMSGFQEYIDLFSTKDYAQVCTLTKNFRGQLAQDADSI